MGSGAVARMVSSARAPETSGNTGSAGGLLGGGSEVEPHPLVREVARIGPSRNHWARASERYIRVHRRHGRPVGIGIGIIGASLPPSLAGPHHRDQLRCRVVFSAGSEHPCLLRIRRLPPPDRRPPMERYIGLDAHASSCTLAVLSPSG